MHYISRDHLGILAQGVDGYNGAKSAVTNYTEKSPLYGFLSCRGRKIVLKYMPEGTSRLLQGPTPFDTPSKDCC